MNKLDLRNEFIFPPIKLGYSDNTGIVNQRHTDFYNTISKDIGAVTIEPLFMDAGLREIPTQLGIDSDDKIKGLKKLTNDIHNQGAKAIAHLNHPGRLANPKIPGNYFWSSTNKPCENGGAAPDEMNQEMMRDVIKLYVDCAKRAVEAGFDIIELQFGHGYLLAQFISPDVNNRNDEYGRSFENRIKFPIEVLKAVRSVVDIPIIARISGDEIIPSGFHIEDMIKFSKILESNGIDAIHVSAGSACSTPPWFFQHMFIPKGKTWYYACRIKAKVKVTVIFVGKINSSEDIKHIEKIYNPDYLAIGRALVADPDFIGKYKNKIGGIIRPCLACSEGCLGGVRSGTGLGCVVNPLVNEDYPSYNKIDKIRKFAIIGGGLAGMQASITLTENGHSVDLYEKNKLGGQFNLAWLPPEKSSMKKLLEFYLNQLKALNINVIKKEVNIEDLEKIDYDSVIIATGAIPAVPQIKGLQEFYWTEFLEDDQLPNNKRVVVIGGGLIGIEVASKLVDGNNQVIIVEMLSEIARGMEMIEKTLTLKKLKEKGTEIFLNHVVTEVNDSTVKLSDKKHEKTLQDIDNIVVAAGMKSYVPFNKVGNLPVYIVGDAEKVGKAQDAIHNAYRLAISL